MSDEALPKLDRITELLADRALFGLDDTEQRELEALMSSVGDIDLESFEHVAASAQLANVGEIEPLPSQLAGKLVEQGLQSLASDSALDSNPAQALNSAQASVSTTADQRQPAKSSVGLPRRELLAWLATAAAVTFALFSVTSGTQSPVELRSELIALASSDNGRLTQVTWSAGEDPAGESASGDVVWHSDRQQGVMKFSGLPANDPAESQYQLWIFDSKQDQRYPIDGGVFDVPAGSKEVFIKIDAKLPVVDPTLFAITIEKPGGVVVSSRERLPLLAPVEK